jgi:hypothetical protein
MPPVRCSNNSDTTVRVGRTGKSAGKINKEPGRKVSW